MEHKIKVYCCFGDDQYETVVETPDSWSFHHQPIGENEHQAFCPKHKLVEKWTNAQCPGCVGGWGDCGLWDAFAYSGRRTLTESDFQSIEKGICPKRVGGTFMVNVSGNDVTMEDLDLSEQAKEGGKVLVDAIKDYWERYPENLQFPYK